MFFSKDTRIIIEDLPGEIWKETYCSPNYEVSNFGRIKNKFSKKSLNGTINRKGYIVVSLDNQNYFLHRIILQTF